MWTWQCSLWQYVCFCTSHTWERSIACLYCNIHYSVLQWWCHDNVVGDWHKHNILYALCRVCSNGSGHFGNPFICTIFNIDDIFEKINWLNTNIWPLTKVFHVGERLQLSSVNTYDNIRVPNKLTFLLFEIQRDAWNC